MTDSPFPPLSEEQLATVASLRNEYGALVTQYDDHYLLEVWRHFCQSNDYSGSHREDRDVFMYWLAHPEIL